MTQSIKDLLPQLAILSREDRADLAYYLIRSLDDAEEKGWEEAWLLELKRRALTVQEGSAQGFPASDVYAEMRKKHS